MANDIKRAPQAKVTSLSTPKRGSNNYQFTSTWKLPNSLSSGDAQAQTLGVRWKIACKSGSSKVTFETHNEVNKNTTTHTLNLASFTDINRKSYNRNLFYPVGKWVITSVTCEVQAYNFKGVGPKAAATRKMAAPPAPTLSNPTISDSSGNGHITCTVHDKGSDYKDSYHTEYEIQSADNADGKMVFNTVSTGTSSSASFTLTRDVTSWQTVGRYVAVRFRARGKGLGGNSAWSAWKMHVTGYPNKPTISSVSIPDTSGSANGFAAIKVNGTKTIGSGKYTVKANMTDHVVLQTLKDTDAATATAAASAAGWENYGTQDDAQCVALAFNVGEVKPQQGNHTWVRVKAWHDVEATFTAFSTPVELSALYDAVDTGSVSITAKGRDDMQTAYVTLSWNSDDMNAVEVAWSDYGKALDSTEGYSSATFLDGSTRTRTVYIRGLEEGTTYYVWARRVKDDTYGAWSKRVTVQPGADPESVVLSVALPALEGRDMQLAWSYGGGGTQTSYNVMMKIGTGKAFALWSGEGPIQACTIPSERFQSYLENLNGATCVLSVRVSTGGAFVESQTVPVLYAGRPSVTLADISDLTAQPLSVTATPTQSVTASLTVTDGTGNCVYSGTHELEASANAVSLPTISLDDGEEYTVEIVGTNSYGLRSDAVSKAFGVVWSRKATAPTVEVAASGTSALITSSVTSAQSGDVVDVYRISGGREDMIAEGLPTSSVLLDPYAPFGEHSYRVVHRTPDGAIDSTDAFYELRHPVLRFDWDDNSVELPWNLELSATWDKDFDSPTMLDGSMPGGWNIGARLRGSYRTDMMRIKESDKVDAVRRLARYTGPVFVRTPDGLAFTANVSVDSLDMSMLGGVGVSASFSCTEIDITESFMGVLQ
ncbi:MAG: hypothetical protein IKF14_10520 [Atopobiaceae bacterium]|nr:hypothetical protein [Atopobiaceae bacterium]